MKKAVGGRFGAFGFLDFFPFLTLGSAAFGFFLNIHNDHCEFKNKNQSNQLNTCQ